MPLTAIPIGLNGLVTPTPLRTYTDAEIDLMKAAFPAGDVTRVEVQIDNLSSFDAFLLQQWGWDAAQAEAIYLTGAPLLAHVHLARAQGFRPLSINCLIDSRQVKESHLQLDAAGEMHSEAITADYQDGLEGDLIELRSLMVTEQPPLIADVSNLDDPWLLLKAANPDWLEHKCIKDGLAKRMPNRTSVMMDMMAPHKAYPVYNDTHRIIADWRVKGLLPEDWRAQRAAVHGRKNRRIQVG